MTCFLFLIFVIRIQKQYETNSENNFNKTIHVGDLVQRNPRTKWEFDDQDLDENGKRCYGRVTALQGMPELFYQKKIAIKFIYRSKTITSTRRRSVVQWKFQQVSKN